MLIYHYVNIYVMFSVTCVTHSKQNSYYEHHQINLCVTKYYFVISDKYGLVILIVVNYFSFVNRIIFPEISMLGSLVNSRFIHDNVYDVILQKI